MAGAEDFLQLEGGPGRITGSRPRLLAFKRSVLKVSITCDRPTALGLSVSARVIEGMGMSIKCVY